MSLFGILGAGTKGMAASQQAAGVSAQNASNVGAQGYTRRSLVPDTGQMGGLASRRVVDTFVERRLLGATSASGEASSARISLAPLDRIFTEGAGGLGASLDEFQAAVQDLSNRPSDSSARNLVVAKANALATSFTNASGELAAARADTDQRIVGAVKSVNFRLHQIAALGNDIARAEVSGQEASDLRDKRDLLIREVAKEIPVTALVNEQGSLTLTLSGSQSLISSDGKVSELSSVRATNGDMEVHKKAAGADTNVTSLITSGAIYGYVKARDGALTEVQTKLDQLAFDMANAYNAAHEPGVGLDGARGRLLFERPLTVEGAALNLAVSADVAGNPDALGAALDAARLPSDNRGALALSAVARAPLAVSGMTASEALISLVGGSGTAVASAISSESFAEGALTQVQALQESVSGVSSDEEMIAMMRYQRAYEASIKVVQVADEMLQQLLQMKR